MRYFGVRFVSLENTWLLSLYRFGWSSNVFARLVAKQETELPTVTASLVFLLLLRILAPKKLCASHNIVHQSMCDFRTSPRAHLALFYLGSQAASLAGSSWVGLRPTHALVLSILYIVTTSLLSTQSNWRIQRIHHVLIYQQKYILDFNLSTNLLTRKSQYTPLFRKKTSHPYQSLIIYFIYHSTKLFTRSTHLQYNCHILSTTDIAVLYMWHADHNIVLYASTNFARAEYLRLFCVCCPTAACFN